MSAAGTGRIGEDITLAEVVNKQADAARVLERYGLDYCCGGASTLGEACRSAGVDVHEVLSALAESPGAERPVEWATMGITELVDHIEETHHQFTKETIGRIDSLFEKVLAVHGEAHPELRDLRSTYEDLRADITVHLAKEEQVLHPMCRELDQASELPRFHCGSLQNPIRVMLYEHERAGSLLRTLSRMTQGYTPPEHACESWKLLYQLMSELEADLHLHIHKENNVLYPKVSEKEAKLSQT